jgi:hypothetical protein
MKLNLCWTLPRWINFRRGHLMVKRHDLPCLPLSSAAEPREGYAYFLYALFEY